MNRSIRTGLLAALACSAIVPAMAQQGSFTIRVLTPETASKAARAALERCREQGYQVAVAVVDRSGVPQVLLRDRFAGAHTVEMAIDKAWTAVSFKQPTSSLAADTQAGRPMSGIRDLPRVLAAGGGVPIDEGGTLFGAIGISGGPGGEADESCAAAGLKAIIEDLTF